MLLEWEGERGADPEAGTTGPQDFSRRVNINQNVV